MTQELGIDLPPHGVLVGEGRPRMLPHAETANPENKTKLRSVLSFLKERWEAAPQHREELEAELLSLAGFEHMEDFIRAVAPQTVIIYMMAGAGSRWRDSFTTKIGSQLAALYGIDPRKPRALAPVANILPPGMDSRPIVPSGTYNLAAFKGLGDVTVVYSGGDQVKQEIADTLVSPLKMRVHFVEQTVPEGVAKPRGHGDALIDVLDKEKYPGKKFLLTVMSNDVSSRRTLVDTLLTLYVLDKYNNSISEVIPATAEVNLFPFIMDKRGLPVDFADPRHRGTERPTGAPSNIGIHGYRLEDLKVLLDRLKRKWQRDYTRLNRAGELGLMDVSKVFMDLGHASLLNVAGADEAFGAKSLTDIPGFLRLTKAAMAHDRRAGSWAAR